MEAARLILEYIEVLIWPALVLAIVVVFRKQLAAILSRLRHAALPGGMSVDFDAGIVEAIELSRVVKRIEPPEGKRDIPIIPLTEANSRMLSLGLRPSPSGLDLTLYSQLTEQDPNVALAALRTEVETLARNLAVGFDVLVDPRDSAGSLLRKLYEGDAITTEQYQLARKVVQLCDAAIHGAKVSRSEAESVIEVARVLTEQYLSWLSWGFPDEWSPNSTDSTNP